MGDHAHDTRNLIRSINATHLTLLAYRRREVILVCFIYSSLMQTDSRGVDIHIRIHDVGAVNIWVICVRYFEVLR